MTPVEIVMQVLEKHKDTDLAHYAGRRYLASEIVRKLHHDYAIQPARVLRRGDRVEIVAQGVRAIGEVIEAHHTSVFFGKPGSALHIGEEPWGIEMRDENHGYRYWKQVDGGTVTLIGEVDEDGLGVAYRLYPRKFGGWTNEERRNQ